MPIPKHVGRVLCFSLLLTQLIASGAARAQDLPVAKPETVGLSSERLDRIFAAVEKSIDDKRIAGAATLVMRHGQVTRLLSRKSVELVTHDQLGKISPDFAFGLGFGIDGVKEPLHDLGSPGTYAWGGFFYTAFSVDPKEDIIVIFMGQLHPTGDLNLDRQVHALAYQAIID